MDRHRTVPWAILATMSFASFVLNWIWEMVQMSAFVEMAGKGWTQTAPVCTVATLGDVLITLAIYAVGALAAGTLQWAARGGWNVYATTTILGWLCAASFEWFSQATDRWHYSESMPIVPVLQVGLWPLLQLTLLVPLSFWIANAVTNRHPGAMAMWADGTDGVHAQSRVANRIDRSNIGSCHLFQALFPNYPVSEPDFSSRTLPRLPVPRLP